MRSTDEAISSLISLAALEERCARLHLVGDHREAPPLIARAGGFHRGVQGQDVGLEGNPLDDAGDLRDLAGAVADGLHGRDHLAHHGVALLRHLRRRRGQFGGVLGIVGVLLYGGGQLFHAGGGFLQRGRLRFGALAQVGVARRDRPGRAGDAAAAVAHLVDDLRQAGVHVGERGEQVAGLVGAFGVDAAAEVAAGHRLRHVHGLADGARDRARDQHARPDRHEHRRDRQRDQQAARCPYCASSAATSCSWRSRV